MNNIKKDILSVEQFRLERPDLAVHTDATVEAAINATATLLNGETGGLIEKCWYEVDPNSQYFRNEYEKSQIIEAFVVQTQYSINLSNDYTQGGGSYSVGNVNSSFSRPENRDIIAPGVLKLLTNARVFNLQLYGISTGDLKNASYYDPYSEEPITRQIGDLRYVEQLQPNAEDGNIAYIGANKMVSWGSPIDLKITTYQTQLIKDWFTGNYLPINQITNLAFFGDDLSGPNSAMTRQQILDLIVKGNFQNKLVAGENITLTPNEDNTTTISASGGLTEVAWGSITGDIANQTDLNTALNSKQNQLTAGANITIENDIISATGGGGSTNALEFWSPTKNYMKGDSVAYLFKQKLRYYGKNVFLILTSRFDNNIGHKPIEVNDPYWDCEFSGQPWIGRGIGIALSGSSVNSPVTINLEQKWVNSLFKYMLGDEYNLGDYASYFSIPTNKLSFYESLENNNNNWIDDESYWKKLVLETDPEVTQKLDSLDNMIREPEYGIKDKVDVLAQDLSNIGAMGFSKFSYGGTIESTSQVVQHTIMSVHADNLRKLCIYTQRVVHFSGDTPSVMTNLQVKMKYSSVTNMYSFYADIPAGTGITSFYSFWGLQQ